MQLAGCLQVHVVMTGAVHKALLVIASPHNIALLLPLLDSCLKHLILLCQGASAEWKLSVGL
jgi:hypothetical protein